MYFVKPGDTLAEISRLFDVDIQRIRELNRLKTTAIKAGDRIRIPDPAAKPAQVAGGSRRRWVSPEPARPATLPKPESLVETSPPREVSSERVLQAVCREETVYHSIVKGETLYSIANRYGTDLDTVLQLNRLRKSARLAIGQRIIVRKSGPRTHTVARRETLARIASRYGVTADDIRRLNRLDRDRIAVGQQLLIEPCDPYAAAGSAPPPLGPNPSARADEGAGGTASETARQSGTTGVLSRQVIDFAKTMLNVPYRFGGSTLRGIDCSAYVQRVFQLISVQIPRTAREQYAVGARIDRGELQVGDLVFFRTYAAFPSHVGIYLGENLFIHASSMVRRVTIDSMDRPYYRKRFIGARRLVDDGAPAVASTP